MSYVRKSLGAHERVVATAHFHWTYGLKAWLALILLFWCLIGIWIFVSMMVRKGTTEIAVTTHRIIYKTGLFNLHANEISLDNVEGVQLQQGLWGRLFGFGRLRIEGTGNDFVELPEIANPIAFRRAIETARDLGAQPVAAREPVHA